MSTSDWAAKAALQIINALTPDIDERRIASIIAAHAEPSVMKTARLKRAIWKCDAQVDYQNLNTVLGLLNELLESARTLPDTEPLVALLRESKREHLHNIFGTWYYCPACPLHENDHDNPHKPGVCEVNDCGADAYNAKVDALIGDKP